MFENDISTDHSVLNFQPNNNTNVLEKSNININNNSNNKVQLNSENEPGKKARKLIKKSNTQFYSN